VDPGADPGFLIKEYGGKSNHGRYCSVTKGGLFPKFVVRPWSSIVGKSATESCSWFHLALAYAQSVGLRVITTNRRKQRQGSERRMTNDERRETDSNLYER
jgi:hypothetical protein